jgi:hypothetical protein
VFSCLLHLLHEIFNSKKQTAMSESNFSIRISFKTNYI